MMNMINDVVSIASKKKCSQCGMIRGLEEFRIDSRYGKPRAECGKCFTHRSRVAKIWRVFGIDESSYYQRMASTGGECQICGDCTSGLAYDHCHEMGDGNPESFRGVLCRLCNVGIGHLGDNLKGVKGAYDYLMEWEFTKKRFLENDGKYGCGETLFRL
jgi:hypothetical protein